ncbi:MAG: hypothetical protein ACPW60_02645 [Methylohalobius sp. ZOD2]
MQKIAQDWKGRGFSCDLWVDSPGQRWEDFVHSVRNIGGRTARWLYGYRHRG